MTRPNLTVIIISYNTKAMTLEALRTLFEHTQEVAMQVMVFDNASQDGSADAIAINFPEVVLIRSKKNLGFAKGNNLVAARTETDWLLLLNPDTEVQAGAVDALVRFAKKHAKNGIYGGRTVFADGSLNPGSCWMRITPWSSFTMGLGLNAVFKNSSIFNSEAIGGWERNTVREVDIVQGSFFLIRREIWEDLGGFNERYFMYGEEADLCLRALSKGWQPIICPEAQIIHLSGAASPSRGDKQVLLAQGRATLVRDHWPRRARFFGLVCLLMLAARRLVTFNLLALVYPERFGDRAQSARMVWNKRRTWIRGYRD